MIEDNSLLISNEILNSESDQIDNYVNIALEDTFHIKHYDDFNSMDWLRDLERYRARHKKIHNLRKVSSDRTLLRRFCGKSKYLIKKIYDNSSAWICVFIVGCLSGALAGLIDISSSWLFDLKSGYCKSNFFFNNEQCCWLTSNSTNFITCSEWNVWSYEIVGNNSHYVIKYLVSYIIYIGFSLFIILCALLIIRTVSAYAIGSGIPEIKSIMSGFIINGYFDASTLIVKSITIILCVSAGLSLGKEGPLVHISCCIGYIVTKLFPKYSKNEAKRREILSAAAAAGVSVAFGAPIGGILFSLEEISYYFPIKTMWRSFFCALSASFVLRIFNPYGNDRLVMFFVDYDVKWYMIEILFFILIGAIGGLLGGIFIILNIKICKYRNNSRIAKYPLVEVVFIAILTAIISYLNSYTRMNTSILIKYLTRRCTIDSEDDICDYKWKTQNIGSVPIGDNLKSALWKLFFAFIFKYFVTVFTFGIKVPSGIFIPTMAIGAIYGRVFGVVLEEIIRYYKDTYQFKEMCANIHGCLTPGLYALLGAAAMLGGVTKMTVSLVVIAFELTGALGYIVPLMVTSMTAKWFSDAITKYGIYDAHVLLNEYPFLEGNVDMNDNSTTGDLLNFSKQSTDSILVIEQTTTILNLIGIINKNDFYGYPIIESLDNKIVIGFIERNDLVAILENLKTVDQSTKVLFINHKMEKNIPKKQDVTPLTSNKIDIPLIFSDVVNYAPMTINILTPTHILIETFRKLGLRQIIVTDGGMLRGIVSRKDILTYLK